MKKIETLIVAGCSHSFGAETISEQHQSHPDSIKNAYGMFLSKKLNCEYKNISHCGISNIEISRRVQQYVDFKNIDIDTSLLIIGWTDPNRFTFYPKRIIRYIERFFEGEAFPYNFSAYTIDFARAYKHIEDSLKIIRDLNFGNEFLSFFRKNIFQTDYYYDLNYILRLQTSAYLSSRNIKHITFSTLKEKPYKNTFKYEKLLSGKNNILEHTDKFNYYDAFRHLGIYKGGHLKIEAHKACADFLYDELIKRKII
jgi:hypothetical protein